MNAIKRIGALLLVIAAIVSLLLTLAGFVGVWALYRPLTDGLAAGLRLTADTLAVTSDTLALVDDGLLTAGSSAAAAQAATQSLAQSLVTTQPALDAAAELLSKGLPQAIAATNLAIEAAQGTAEGIDNVLTVLADIPFLGIKYNPDTPLAATLGNISANLNGVPANLQTVGRQLSTSSENLPSMVDGIDLLAGSLGRVQTTIAAARQATQQYQRLIARYQDAVAFLQRGLRFLTILAPLLLSLFLFWLGVVQVHALWRGLEWLGLRQPATASSELSQPAPATPPEAGNTQSTT